MRIKDTNIRYTIGQSIFLCVADLVLTVQFFALMFWGEDFLNIVPSSADRTDEVLIALALAIWTELISIKWNVFGKLGVLFQQQKEEAKQR